MLEVLHNVPLTSLYSPAQEKNAGDCEKRPDSCKAQNEPYTPEDRDRDRKLKTGIRILTRSPC